MNVEISEDYSFKQVLQFICENVSERKAKLKKEIGVGEVTFYEQNNGLAMYIIDAIFSVPLLVKWNFSENHTGGFYLSHNLTVIEPNTNFANTVEPMVDEGTVLFTGNNERRRLWIPNIRYQLVILHFNYDWLRMIDKTIALPSNFLTYFEKVKEVMFSIGFSAELKQISNQIKFVTSILNKKSQASYVHIKCMELLLFAFDIAHYDVSVRKVKNAIHPSDIKLIVQFVDRFNNASFESITMDEAAYKLGMSKSKFQRVFKRVIGTNYYKFILKNRMMKAMELLMYNNSVTDVAIETGYSATGNFTQAFKNYYNILPSDIIGINE